MKWMSIHFDKNRNGNFLAGNLQKDMKFDEAKIVFCVVIYK